MQSAPRSPEGRARSAMVCTEVALRTALVPGRRGGCGGAPRAGSSAFSACPAGRTVPRVVTFVVHERRSGAWQPAGQLASVVKQERQQGHATEQQSDSEQ